MPSVLYANDLGQLGGLLEAERRTQQQQAQFEAEQSRLSNYRNASLAQNRQNALLGLVQNREQLAERKAERADEMGYKNRALKLNEDYQNWLMKQPSKGTAKTDAAAENFALNDLVDKVKLDGSLDTNNTAFKKAHPLVQQTLLAAATDRREELKPLLDRKFGALKIAKQAASMEAVADGLKDTKQEGKPTLFSRVLPAFGLAGLAGMLFGKGADPNAADPQLIAQDLKKKAADMKSSNRKLLDEAGLTQDPITKQFTSHFPDWYKEMTGRLLKMATPPTAGTGTNVPPQMAAPPGADPRAVNIATPPPSMTGTNQPVPVRVRLSDGRILRTTSDKLPAVAARDPKAVLVQ